MRAPTFPAFPRRNGQHVIITIGYGEGCIMQEKPHQFNFEFALRSGRSGGIEFWRDNGDGTCTRLADGLTLTYERYDDLPARRHLPFKRYQGRLKWDA
jgi:hypothetical protein